MEHHECGPSKLGRIMACPGSVRLERGEPDNANKDAVEGTLLHAAVAKLISGDEDYREGITIEQVDDIERCYYFLDEVCTGRPRKLLIEKMVTLSDAKGVINFGTADVIAIMPKKVVIIDWKFGRKIKEDALSLQIANYAAAAVQSVPEVKAVSKLPIEAWAYFPRLGEKLQWTAYTGAVCSANLCPKIRAIVESADDPDAPVNPGPHCDYCRHLPNCAAVREVASKEIMPASAQEMASPARAIYLYDMAAIVEKQCKSVRAAIRDQLLRAPDSIPGLVMKKRGGKRSVVDSAELKSRFMASKEFNVLDWMDALEPNVVALERAYVKKHHEGRGNGKPTLQQIKKRFADLAGDLIKKSETTVLERVNND